MAGSISDYLESKILDHMTGKTQFTFPTSRWVGLFTTAPTDAGGGVEVSGGSYARLEFNGATGRAFTAASGGAAENSAAWEFATASADWGTIVAFGIFDALSGGNMEWWGDITPNKLVSSGDTARFASGALDLSVT